MNLPRYRGDKSGMARKHFYMIQGKGRKRNLRAQ